jgi:hypothetical protein
VGLTTGVRVVENRFVVATAVFVFAVTADLVTKALVEGGFLDADSPI